MNQKISSLKETIGRKVSVSAKDLQHNSCWGQRFKRWETTSYINIAYYHTNLRENYRKNVTRTRENFPRWHGQMLQWTKLITRNVAKVKAASTAAKLCATMSVAYSDSNLEPHALSYQDSLSFACLILAYSRKDSVWIEWHLCWACAVCCQDFFEPKPKSRAIGTVGSVMTDGLFLLGCSSSEEKKKSLTRWNKID